MSCSTSETAALKFHSWLAKNGINKTRVYFLLCVTFLTRSSRRGHIEQSDIRRTYDPYKAPEQYYYFTYQCEIQKRINHTIALSGTENDIEVKKKRTEKK